MQSLETKAYVIQYTNKCVFSYISNSDRKGKCHHYNFINKIRLNIMLKLHYLKKK